MGWLNKALLVGAFAAWYAFTGPSAQHLEPKKEYPVPNEIKVVSTTLPYETREAVGRSADSVGNFENESGLEKIIKTEDIDFSKNFTIETERYTIVKKEEPLISRVIGHINSIPAKLFFWDWNVGKGLDKEKTRAIISILENNENIKDLTVRINHNQAIYDYFRLFTDKKVAKRNPLIPRILMGIPTSILGELFAELSRGDYYNPMNQTVVLFSNIKSISAHEIGHHKDCQRFGSDWIYASAAVFPPVVLYREWQASQNAKHILSDEDKWQFNRYLIPAFFTYLIAGFYASKKLLKQKAPGKKPEISTLQTLRHFGTLNLDLYAGIAAYSLCDKINVSGFVSYAALAAGAVITNEVANHFLKNVMPYEHENL
ncbi:hypothetical protein COV14_03830 [Candidatus Woesearchaeota archaeon CG10_big_fil_rev_8_21_14_0_10_33_12]|nr:MAG: hypothetical protein COV14_03830 [Candidatus Woesearchaeota archaeon CG10_big_fil_rev_8_21_14_0_10_33_12]